MTAGPLPTLPKYQDDATTRTLCASVHLHDRFAAEVNDELTAESMAGLGLPLGVNLVALARHARSAVRRLEARDRRLGGLWMLLWLAALGCAYGLVTGNLLLAAICAGAVPLVLAAAWWLVYLAEVRARSAALDVWSGTSGKPGASAPELPRAVEDRLRGHRRPNLIPYHASVDQGSPFVGSGRRVSSRVWQPIDVSRPATGPNGDKLTIIPFEAVDLHTYVARTMETIAGLEGLRGQNRLYARGDYITYLGEDALPDPLGPPLSRIPQKWVKAGLREAAGMRTYLSLERLSGGGRVVVSMHLHAQLLQPSLTWEVSAYVIDPVAEEHHRVNGLPRDGFERWWDLVRFASRTTGPALKGALGRTRERAAVRAARAKALAKQRKDITKRHVLHDYGVLGSIRERVGSRSQLTHFDRTDSQHFLHRLQRGVLTATEQFLKDHNVDTSSYEQAQQVINNQTYNINGDINGPSNFGDNGQINGYGQGQQAGGNAGQGASAQP